MAWGYVVGAGAILQGYAAYRAGQSRASILRKNARLLEKAAEQRIYAGQEEKRLVREQVTRDEGAMVNVVHASGFTVYGSPLAKIVEHVQSGEMEARQRLTIARLEADQMREQARIMRAEARAAEEGGILGAAAAGLGGLGDYLVLSSVGGGDSSSNGSGGGSYG